VSQRFLAQLLSFNPKSDIVRIAERIKAASSYFVPQLDDLLVLIESSPAITESKVEAQDYIERLQTVFEIASQLRHIIAGIADDISVVNYFDVKQSYKVPPFKVKAYVVEREVKMLKTDHPKLYKMLASWRNDYCKENNIPAFTMFGNATLVEVSNRLPIEIEQLTKIKGFGKIKIQRYGKECIDIVRIYCRENGIDASMQSDIAFEPESEYDDEKPKRRKNKDTEKIEKTPTEEITYSLLVQGKTPQDVAEERNLTVGTIYTHMAKLIHAKKIDIVQYVDVDLLSRVMSILDQTPEMSNSELFEQLNGVATYDDLKLIRAHQLLVSSSLHYSNGDK
jgi:DNA-binding CsgD family transcriptional regulator